MTMMNHTDFFLGSSPAQNEVMDRDIVFSMLFHFSAFIHCEHADVKEKDQN